MAKGKSKKQEKQRSRPVTWSQFLAIILITIALTVVLDFGRRAAVSAGLQKEAQQLEREVATLEAETRALELQREWVQTDAYVEEWARTEGIMVLYGETPIVPLPAGQARPTEGVAPASPSESPKALSENDEEATDHWREWWALFFGPEDELATSNQGE